MMNKKKISIEAGIFYQKLYEKKIVKDCEIEEIVHIIPTLSDEEVNDIKGKITLEEVQSFFGFLNVLETTWTFCCKITQ